MTVASPTPFQTSTRATETSAVWGLPSQSGPVIPTQLQNGVDQAGVGRQQHAEGDADRDRADQDGKEHQRAQQSAHPDARGQQDRQEHAEHDLQAAGDDRVDDGVPQAAAQRLLGEELAEVVQAGELGIEEGPPGEGEVERHHGRDDEDDRVDDAGGEVEQGTVGVPEGTAPPAGPRWRRGGPAGLRGVAEPDRPSLTRPGLGHHPGRPNCLASLMTSWSYWAAPCWGEVCPVPTATQICSRDGPFTGDRNSSAGENALLVM